jgi:uncharacterized membrane protein YgcG
MKIKTLSAATFSALLIFGAAPAIAVTINNQLDTAPGALQYNFKPGFKESIEQIEKRHGLEFYIYAQPYNIKTELLDPRKNAGANIADEKLSGLLLEPKFDYDNAVIVTWLRNQDEPIKGSIGVAPGKLLQGFGIVDENLSREVTNSIKGYMPGDPSGAIISIAKNMDKPFGLVDMLGRLVKGLGLIGSIVGGAFLIKLTADKISSKLVDQKETRLANEQILANTKDSIEQAKLSYLESLEHPSMLFDLKLADDYSGAIESSRYDALLVEIKLEIDALDEKWAKASNHGHERLELSDNLLLAKAEQLVAFMKEVEQTYSQFLAVRSNKEALIALIPPEPTTQFISATFDKDEIIGRIEPSLTHYTVPNFEDLVGLLDNLPISYSDYSLFIKKIEERAVALSSHSQFIDQAKNALKKMEVTLDRVRNIDLKQFVRPLTHSATPGEEKEYDHLYLMVKDNLDNFAIAPVPILKDQIKNALEHNNLVDVIDHCQGLELAVDASIYNPINELNRIAVAPSARVKERDSAQRAARQAAGKRTPPKTSNSSASYGYYDSSSSNESGSSSWSSSSSSDYSSGSSSSDYSSGSGGSDYSSGSGGGDY